MDTYRITLVTNDSHRCREIWCMLQSMFFVPGYSEPKEGIFIRKTKSRIADYSRYPEVIASNALPLIVIEKERIHRSFGGQKYDLVGTAEGDRGAIRKELIEILGAERCR